MTSQAHAHEVLRQLAAPARVLVVDDEASIRDLLSVMLAMTGLAVDTAEDGDRALAAVASCHYDLITLDVMMPGKDGWAVAEALDANPATAGIPRIMVSGVPLAELRAAPGASTAAAVLSKPFDFATFDALVRTVLHLDEQVDRGGPAPGAVPDIPAPRSSTQLRPHGVS